MVIATTNCMLIMYQEYIISNLDINCRDAYLSLAHFSVKEKSFREVKEFIHNYS